jgi:uncharacterized membrane protein
MKKTFRWILALVFIAGGLFHFIYPDFYLEILPDWFPAPRFLVGLSGLLEILGGTGLLWPDLRSFSSTLLLLLLLAMVPIHIQHVMDKGYISEDIQISPVFAWLRLLFQGVLIAWARWVR